MSINYYFFRKRIEIELGKIFLNNCKTFIRMYPIKADTTSFLLKQNYGFEYKSNKKQL